MQKICLPNLSLWNQIHALVERGFATSAASIHQGST